MIGLCKIISDCLTGSVCRVRFLKMEFFSQQDHLSFYKISLVLFQLFLILNPCTGQTEGDMGYDYRDTDNVEFDEFAALGKDPSFDVPFATVTGKLGNVALLRCSIDYLGKFKVAWLENNSIPLTYEDRRIIDDFRFSIVRPSVRDWHLQIRDVRVEDSGYYRCTVNTRPVTNKLVKLIVTVPPRIIDTDTSRDTMIKEGHNVSLRCNATGIPTPRITWYRRPSEIKMLNLQQSGGKCKLITSPAIRPRSEYTEYRQNSVLNIPDESAPELIGEGHLLNLHNVSRYCDDVFECVADNGVAPKATRRISLTVEFRPEIILPNRRISQAVGKQTILECTITAFPQAITFWQKDDRSLTSAARYKIEAYDEGHHKVTLSLRIIDVQLSDFGDYKCIASNAAGRDEQTMQLLEYEIENAPLRQSRYWLSTSHPLSEQQHAVIVLPPSRANTAPVRSHNIRENGYYNTASTGLSNILFKVLVTFILIKYIL